MTGKKGMKSYPIKKVGSRPVFPGRREKPFGDKHYFKNT
jgi:hypothetical protein